MFHAEKQEGITSHVTNIMMMIYNQRSKGRFEKPAIVGYVPTLQVRFLAL